MTPYWLPKIVAIVCAVVYVVHGDAGRVSKVIVVGVVVLSLYLQHGADFAHAWTIGLVLQALIGVFVLVSLRLPGSP